MSMLDAFFNKGFKAAKCKTLLKLTIPRIKLLRNRREIQIKQMRKDIAKLLETGQEATARIRVEHIIREENMMAAQEIIELFCELISVRLPIIEAQRECPLDLKEAISSVCFAAPRCADLPELLQVQLLIAAKYGKEFVSAATELMPDCGVNRQLIELLSVRAPAPNVKLKLLKEIAEEHELDWDPAVSETEFFKSHEDLLDGPTQFVSGSKLPLPEEKHEPSPATPDQDSNEQSDSDGVFDSLDFPEVPKVPLRSRVDVGLGSEIGHPSVPAAVQPEVFPAVVEHSEVNKTVDSAKLPLEPEEMVQKSVDISGNVDASDNANACENKQFVPFISPPSISSLLSARRSNSPASPSRTKSEVNVDLHDVLAAAQAAAKSAERAAAEARSAASLAEARISEVMKKNSKATEDTGENPFGVGTYDQTVDTHHPSADHRQSVNISSGVVGSDSSLSHLNHESKQEFQSSNHPPHAYDTLDMRTPLPGHRQPQRQVSMDDDSYFSYPNLFNSQDSNLGSNIQSFTDKSGSAH